MRDPIPSQFTSKAIEDMETVEMPAWSAVTPAPVEPRKPRNPYLAEVQEFAAKLLLEIPAKEALSRAEVRAAIIHMCHLEGGLLLKGMQ